MIPPRLLEQGDEIEIMREVVKNRMGAGVKMTAKDQKTLPLHHPLLSKASSRKIVTIGTIPLTSALTQKY